MLCGKQPTGNALSPEEDTRPEVRISSEPERYFRETGSRHGRTAIVGGAMQAIGLAGLLVLARRRPVDSVG